MTKLQLSTAQQALIENASFALPPRERDLLHRRVLEELETMPEIGDGTVYRACREVQRGLFTPPNVGSSRPTPLKKIGGSAGGRPAVAYWSCAQLVPGRTKSALHFLGRKFEVYCPRIRSASQKSEDDPDDAPLLFPSYTFFLVVADQWYRAQRTPGVLKVLTHNDHPAKVADGVIEELRAREHKGMIELPSPPRLQRGTQVRIIAGAFADRLALYHGQRAHERVAVLLRMLGGEHHLVLPRHHITEMPSGHARHAE